MSDQARKKWITAVAAQAQSALPVLPWSRAAKRAKHLMKNIQQKKSASA